MMGRLTFVDSTRSYERPVGSCSGRTPAWETTPRRAENDPSDKSLCSTTTTTRRGRVLLPSSRTRAWQTSTRSSGSLTTCWGECSHAEAALDASSLSATEVQSIDAPAAACHPLLRRAIPNLPAGKAVIEEDKKKGGKAPAKGKKGR